MADAFETELLTILPQLRAMAMILARDRVRADDLLQDSLVLALAGKGSFELGTNLKAWMYRVMRNRLISLARKRRVATISLDEPAAMAVGSAGNQEDHMACRELEREMAQLPVSQQEALLLVGVAGCSYDEAAEAVGCSVGTVKSRVSRARDTLEARLVGRERPTVSSEAQGAAVPERVSTKALGRSERVALR